MNKPSRQNLWAKPFNPDDTTGEFSDLADTFEFEPEPDTATRWRDRDPCPTPEDVDLSAVDPHGLDPEGTRRTDLLPIVRDVADSILLHLVNKGWRAESTITRPFDIEVTVPELMAISIAIRMKELL